MNSRTGEKRVWTGCLLEERPETPREEGRKKTGQAKDVQSNGGKTLRKRGQRDDQGPNDLKRIPARAKRG